MVRLRALLGRLFLEGHLGLRFLELFAEIAHGFEAGINFRIGVEQIEGDYFGFGFRKLVNQLTHVGARPGPAADLGDGSIVDGNDNDFVADLTIGAELGAQVVQF